MSVQSATPKLKQKQSRKSQRKRKPPLEFSKKLTIADIIVYVVIALVLLTILFLNPESLGEFAQTIFAYLTTAYVSLRLGYTAKAGVENYKKIAENYKSIAELASDREKEEEDEEDCESDDEEESLG